MRASRWRLAGAVIASIGATILGVEAANADVIATVTHDRCTHVVESCEPGGPCYVNITILGESAQRIIDAMKQGDARTSRPARPGYETHTSLDRALFCVEEKEPGPTCTLQYDVRVGQIEVIPDCGFGIFD